MKVVFRGQVLPIMRPKDAELANTSHEALLPVWVTVKKYKADTIAVYLHETRYNNTPTYFLVKKGAWIVIAKAFGKT